MQQQIKTENHSAPSADIDADQSQESINTTSAHPSIAAERGPMRLIPWEDIWSSLHDARIRGQGGMIEVFYETLFKDAVFDDDGAWSQEQSHHN